jgi:plasmid segregation protein ParM
MSDPIVRSMDIGFGNTKVLVGYDAEGNPQFFYFPSLAPKAARSEAGESFGDSRDTVVVDVNGLQYEVGPDSIDLANDVESRILHDQYVFSDQYQALFRGGLYYMDTPEIDFLQLGLPFNMMHNAEEVRKNAIGEFTVGDRKVIVKDAGVIEQPLGGYEYHCANASDGEDMEDEVVLIIDPGYYTFDWVIVKNGKLIEPRSGAVQGGVSRVLSMVAKAISEKHLKGEDYNNLEAVDKALMKESRTLRIYGKKYDLTPLLSAALPAIDGPINQMINRVGDMKDIDRVVLLSGGARMFKLRLTKLLHKFEIEIPNAGIFANCWGYQEKAFKTLGLK